MEALFPKFTDEIGADIYTASHGRSCSHQQAQLLEDNSERMHNERKRKDSPKRHFEMKRSIDLGRMSRWYDEHDYDRFDEIAGVKWPRSSQRCR